MRIVFGLSQTLVDIEECGLDFTFNIRSGAFDLLQILKQQGHVLILWTGKKRRGFNSIKRKSVELFELFDEIYCKEDFELVEDIPGYSLHLFKNINKIKADCLIESKPIYKKYASNLQMGEKYFIIDKYREFLFAAPSKWIVQMDIGAVEKSEKRRQEKENWVMDVFDFITQLKGDKINAC